MKRRVEHLAKKQYDIIVIGAGVHGACIARDAALRGLTVALIDKGDVCGQTSHNSLKIIHGGIRYLQHLDLKRTWESIQEQKYWLATMPHLVKPMRCIMPTYGHGLRGPEAMWCGIKTYESMGYGRNRHIPSHRRIPQGKVVSRQKCLELIPGVNSANLTGAAIWYDAQVFGADDAVIETAASAHLHGAEVANYLTVSELLVEDQKVIGVRAKDELTKQTHDIHSKLVVNATGPWVKKLLSALNINQMDKFDLGLTKSMNIVTRPLFNDYAVAIQSKLKSDSVVGSSKRLYFFTPWGNSTVVGTTHFPYVDNPDSLEVSKQEVNQFITEINEVYPPAKLTLSDVRYCYKGLTPAEDQESERSGNHEAIRSRQSKIIDHSENKIEGLISVIGVKFTTARLIAEKCTDLVFSKLGKSKVDCRTRTEQLNGSYTSSEELAAFNEADFKKYCQDQIDNTMVLHLTDLVLRRMDLVAQGLLTQDKLAICVEVMSQEFEWSSKNMLEEIEMLKKIWLNPILKQNLENVGIIDT